MNKGLSINTTYIVYPLFAYISLYCFGLVEPSGYLTAAKWVCNVLLAINVVLGVITIFALSKINSSKVKIKSTVKKDKSWLMYVFLGLDLAFILVILTQGPTKEFSFILATLPLKWITTLTYKKYYSNVIKKGTLK